MAEIGSYINIAATLLKLQKFVKNFSPVIFITDSCGVKTFRSNPIERDITAKCTHFVKTDFDLFKTNNDIT